MIKKIVVCGLPESGKTTLINSITLDMRSLPDIIGLRSTRGRSITHITIKGTEFIIWELAGAESYRRRRLSEIKSFLSASELIFVIDTTRILEFIDSLIYVSEIIDFINCEVKDYLDDGFTVYILFHKVDRTMSLELFRKIRFMKKEIKRQTKMPFRCKFYKTTKFNYKDFIAINGVLTVLGNCSLKPFNLVFGTA